MTKTTKNLPKFPPINVGKAKNNRFYVAFENGQRRFIADKDQEYWNQKVGEYWAELSAGPREPESCSPKVAESGHEPIKESVEKSTIHKKKNERRIKMSKSTKPQFQGESLKQTVPQASTDIRLQGHIELDYDGRDLGFILRGFVEKARDCGPDPHTIFMKEEHCQKQDPREAKLMELGRELFATLPAAMSFFSIAEEEWGGWYKSASPASCNQNQGSRRPASRSNAGVARLASTAWLAPVQGPITSSFGQQRAQGVHEGIDVGVPVGTNVVAPAPMKVEKVGFSERAGRFVVANVMRPEGDFDDGDGYRLTFAHLSEVQVEEDEVVERGEGFARSGATGQVTGPHLHFRVQWVEDGFFSDDVLSIDPLSVIPEQVFGGMQPVQMGARQGTALRQGQPINIVIAPGAGRVSAGGTGVMQPDLGIQLPQRSVEQSSYRGGPQGNDPLAGIVTEIVDEVPNFIRTVGDVAQAAGTIASVGGTLASFIPGAAPVALPVAAVGSAIGTAAQPVAQAGAGVVQVGANVAQGDHPLKGILF